MDGLRLRNKIRWVVWARSDYVVRTLTFLLPREVGQQKSPNQSGNRYTNGYSVLLGIENRWIVEKLDTKKPQVWLPAVH